jgi:riboflavin kinase/FMN adenylyltransferase
MQIEATKFIEILCKNLNMKYLVVGTDFTFGYKKSGNVELLKKISNDYGFELKIIDKLKKDDRDISSSYIREELMKGNLDIVNEMLGYEYFIFGEVINIGEFPRNKFGNPIIIIPPKNKLIPKLGYYITNIIYDKKKLNAITHIGENLFNWKSEKPGNNVIIDSYIFDYNHNLFEKNIIINFEKFIGDKIKFDTIEEFKEQIK